MLNKLVTDWEEMRGDWEDARRQVDFYGFVGQGRVFVWLFFPLNRGTCQSVKTGV